MRVTCHQCTATLTLEEDQLEDGPAQLECVNCEATVFVDTGGRAFESEAALQEAYQTRSLPKPPPEPGSDAYATIPLPSLDELGLNPFGMSSNADQREPSAPPRMSSIPDADLDAENVPAPGVGAAARVAPVAPVAPPPAPVAAPVVPAPPVAARSSQFDLDATRPSRSSIQRVTVSIPVPPVTRPGWALLGGIALFGLLCGGLFSAGSSSTAPFNRAAARDAVQQATRRAIACFDTAPKLQGTLQLVLTPSGDVAEVGLDGTMTKLAEADCMRRAYSSVRVAPFSGPPVRVERTLALAAAE